jgi:autotransporter-associated beta strand protein
MKARTILRQATLLGLAVCITQAHAASGSWTTAASGDWSTGPWTGGVPNGAGETATFSHDWTGQTITVDGTFVVGSILATDTANNGGLLLSGGTLTLDNGVNKPVIQTSAGFTEPGGSSPFNNPLRITSVLAGSNGFEKTGAGYLSLEAENTFTGNVKLTGTSAGSFLRLINDNNLGATGNDIEVALSGSATGLYASTGISPTLNANRNIITSGSGAFWVKNKGTSNLTIEGVISGSAQLRKNDSGTLTLTGANTFTGGTLLDGGTLVLSGGDNRLASDRAVTFNSASTLDLTNTSQTVTGLGLLQNGVTNTISGNGGTLIHNATGDYTVNTTVTGTSLDMSGLSNYTFNRTGGSYQLNANGANVVNTIHLAKAGTNTINVTNARFGGGSNNAGQNVLIGLGQNNNINASAEFVIGYFQGSGNVSFQNGLTNPALTVRGAGGVGATPLMTVGSTNSGNQSSTGILNLTGGSLDVIATELNVARHFANAGGTSATGTITMPAGTVVASTLNLAVKTNTSGAPTLTGTFNQSGGTVSASTLNLGNNSNAEAPNLIANYNLSGGTLFAAAISGSGATYGGSTVRNLNVSGGTLRNLSGSDLTVNGVANTPTGRINLNITGASTIHADALQTVSLGTHTALSGSGNLAKDGDGTLVVNGASSSYTGAVTVTAGTLLVTGQLGSSGVTVGDGATLAGNGTIGASVVFASDAYLDFGSSLLVSSGTITFGSGFDMSNILGLDGSAATGTYTLISGPADVDLTGVLNVGAGNAYDLGSGKSAYFQEGSLQVVVIPEPGAILIGGLGTLLLLRRRR